MAGLVEQIQIAAASNTSSVSDLLRHVKLAAAKLKLDDAMEWVDFELNGYDGRDIPEYRKVIGQPKAFNPYSGWIPIHGDSDFQSAISRVWLREPITSLENLAASDSGYFTVPLSHEVISVINRANGIELGTMANHFSPGVVINIIARVRTLILDWAINLERIGVNGEGVSFTPEEKERASNATINIHAFHGNLHQGDISGVNARANLGSTDNSCNVTSGATILSDLEQEIRARIGAPARDELLRLVREMQDTKASSQFIPVYQRFMAAAANHMTVIAPFLPALAVLIPS